MVGRVGCFRSSLPSLQSFYRGRWQILPPIASALWWFATSGSGPATASCVATSVVAAGSGSSGLSSSGMADPEALVSVVVNDYYG